MNVKRTVPALYLSLVGILGPAQGFAFDRKEVLLHPFGGPKSADLKGKGVDASLVGTTEALVRGLGLNPRVQMKNNGSKGFNLYGNQKIESEEFLYEIDGYPVCDLQLKAHRTLDGKTAFLGEIPKIRGEERFNVASWAEFDTVRRIVGESIVMSGKGTEFSVEDSSQCLLLQDERLHPVWRVDVSIHGLLYQILADGNEVYRYDPKHFDATGSAKIFPSNPTDGALETFELREMKDGNLAGYLVNEYFETCVPASNGSAVCPSIGGSPAYALARKTNLDFSFDPSSQSNEFIQASIFTNVNRALEWLEQRGYENFGGTAIRLLAHASISGDVNNALYNPGSPPSILVGDGDGDSLQNLGIDADVVSHELGHHVVYSTVTTIAGQSLVIHEGLADFFTFARTGDACLGESICPNTQRGGLVCAVPRTCLRTAENTLNYTSSNLPSAPHLQGQLVSGMLWDLYKTDQIPLDDVAVMTLKAVDLLVANSGYQHLIVALMLADHANFDGKYCSTILNRAVARGFSGLLTDVTCEEVDETGTAFTGGPGGSVADFITPGGSTAEVIPAPSKKSSKGCGVLSAGRGSGQFGAFLLLWIIPIIAAWIRRFRS